ncbi:hypothetical protein [Vulcanisaeta souniana]|uniref:hypothetical protein n=1 Tax=Vulcanisaeta souniana TaxID=164452 RepID=UPI000B0AA197|nr:hypothetical protein [Vulcanisaeta souniana]
MNEYNKDCKKVSGCMSMAKIQRILVKLVRKRLIKYEKRGGKAHHYELTPLGMMLVGIVKPSKAVHET